MAHVPQEQAFGPAFIPAYLLAELFPGVNPFESAADKAAVQKYLESVEGQGLLDYQGGPLK